ncbi:MAG TPA: MBL fold metallo-hydrolase [Acidimicrobiia bacterium]|jgi:ribonuclease BN (tRNA processing enzyme)|nr:MBL fold metallo-hydrolase [Acidimicrobiia bacterium]
MRVHVVGSSGTYPAQGRPASGFVVEQGSTRVWCDAGPGTFTALPIDPDMISAVVVSHQHPDHCTDLFAAYHAWTYRPQPRDAVPLYAPQAVWDRITQFIEKQPECFAFTPVTTGDEVVIDGLKVSFVETEHPVPTVASRWEANNRSLFYTADTGPGGDWRAAASDAHIMLAEASYQGAAEDKAYPHHLTAGEAGQIAREVGAEQLTLTHIPPYLDPAVSVAEAEETFDRPVRLAVPATSFEV